MKVLEKFGISGKLGGRTFALLLLVFSLLLSSVPVSAAGVERGRDGSDGMAAGSDAVPGVSGAGVFSFGLRSGLEEFDAGALDPDRWDSGPDGYGHEAFVQVGGNPGNGFSMQLRYVYEEGGKTVKATYGEAAGNNTLDKASSYLGQIGGNGFQGALRIFPSNAGGDLPPVDMTVAICFPKGYTRRDSLGLDENSLENFGNGRLLGVRETETEYVMLIEFSDVSPSKTMGFTFNLAFVGNIIPVDYAYLIRAFMVIGDGIDIAGPNPYQVTYHQPKFQEFVNTNASPAMGEDGVLVAADVAAGADGNTYLQEGCVTFQYKAFDGDPWYPREYDRVTLTKSLWFEYPGPGGEPVRFKAAFDPGANPGWQLSEDGDSVYMTFDTDKSCLTDGTRWAANLDHEQRISGSKSNEPVELKLRFPGLPVDEEFGEGDGKFLAKSVKGSASLSCRPSNPHGVENSGKIDVVEDGLTFRLTDRKNCAGNFTKNCNTRVVIDTEAARRSLVTWTIGLENTQSYDFHNVVLADCDLSDSKLDGIGLDERLKLHSIRLRAEDMDKIGSVEVGYYDGPGRPALSGEIALSDFTQGGKWREYVFPDGVACGGFMVSMRGDYVMKPKDSVVAEVTTTFRDPDSPHYVPDAGGDEENSANAYRNDAVAFYDDNAGTYYSVFSGNCFIMRDAPGYIRIGKRPAYDSVATVGGGPVWYYLTLHGSLPEDKACEDLRIVDLLPEYGELHSNPIGSGGAFVRSYYVIENYRNTGRDAVIFHLDPDEVRRGLATTGSAAGAETQVLISCGVVVTASDAMGQFTNDAWLVSDDLEDDAEYCDYVDVYDVDGDGDVSEKIRHADAPMNIGEFESCYCRQYIGQIGKPSSWRLTSMKIQPNGEFGYRLCVVNTSETEYENLVVCDVLPSEHTKSVNGQQDLPSDYRVRLAGPIDPGPGYTVHYTTDEDAVYSLPMSEWANVEQPLARGAGPVEWLTADDVAGWGAGEWEDVTAFRLVANDGVILGSQSEAVFEVPVRSVVPEGFDASDGVRSVNSFGYGFGGAFRDNMESNYVRTEFPRADLSVEKVDWDDGGVRLPGVGFRLEKKVDGGWRAVAADGNLISDESLASGAGAVTDQDGIARFENLGAGEYRLTETAAAGYVLDGEPVVFRLETADPETLDVRVVLENPGDGRVSAEDGSCRIVFRNRQASFELPSTGGAGVAGLYAAGAALAVLAVCAAALRRRRSGPAR